MLIFYLLLAHLISDYLLQPLNLVVWKNRSHWGVGVHATVHFLVNLLMLYLFTGHYLYPGLIAFGVAFLHFCIDCVKASYDQKTQHTQLAYWTDQCAHYLTIITFFLISLNWPTEFSQKTINASSYFDQIFFNPVIITFSCLSIFVTLSIEYSFWHNREKQNPKVKLINRRQMLKRLFLAAIIYTGLLFAFIPSMSFNF